jgi:hypothetical protein
MTAADLSICKTLLSTVETQLNHGLNNLNGLGKLNVQKPWFSLVFLQVNSLITPRIQGTSKGSFTLSE